MAEKIVASLISGLSRDGKVLLAIRASRNFAFGFSALILTFYLEALGYSAFTIGVLLSLTLVGSTLANIVVGLWSNRFGRKRMLILFSTLMTASSIVLVLSPSIHAVAVALLVGSISSTGSESGPFAAVEQAALPSTSRKEDLNMVFSYYNITSRLAAAIGALFFGLRDTLASRLGLGMLESYRVYFVVYAVISLVLVLLYSVLSRNIEIQSAEPGTQPPAEEVKEMKHKSTVIAMKLSGLFSMDGLGQGFVIQSFVAFWFQQKFQTNQPTLSLMFFISQMITLGTYYLAGKMANRLGIIKTVVLVSVPANLCLFMIPLVPTFLLSAGFYLTRNVLSRMDEPTRQAYVVSVVAPEHRTGAAALVTVTNTAAQSVGPSIAGSLLQASYAFAPFFLAGGVKLTYNFLLYHNFKNIHE